MTVRIPSKRAIVLIALLAEATMASLPAQEVVNGAVRNRSGGVGLRLLVDGLHHPWAVAPLPGGGALVTERRGRLLYISSLSPGSGSVSVVAGVPDVVAAGQGGLLDVVLSPDFENDATLFLTHTATSRHGPTTRLSSARFVVENRGPRLEEVRSLATTDASGAGGRHFGSRIAVDADGFVYVTVGDRGVPERSQDIRDDAGTVLRFRLDGSPAGAPDIRARGGNDAVYSYGHRNAQGMAVHPDTGAVWLHEHGPRGGDEINVVREGANYGWPRTTFGINYNRTPITDDTSLPGIEPPILHWTPSIAPSGMAFVTTSRYPGLVDTLLVGALAARHLRVVRLAGESVVGQEELFSGVARFRDVREGPNGWLYIVTDHSNGGLFRLEP